MANAKNRRSCANLTAEIVRSATDAVEMAKSRIPFSSDCLVFGVKYIGRYA